jgi:hypothetical protein
MVVAGPHRIDPVPVVTAPPPPAEGGPWVPSLDAAALAATAADALLVVDVTGCGYRRTGTAFAIDSRTVLTAWHFAALDSRPALRSPGGEPVEAQVIGWSQEHGVAVLRTATPLPAWLAPPDPDHGTPRDEVALVGLSVSTGEVVAVPALVADPAGAATAGGSLAVRPGGGEVPAGGAVLGADGTLVGVVLAPDLRGTDRTDRVQPYDVARPGIGRFSVAPAPRPVDCTLGGELPDPNRSLASARFGRQNLTLGSDPVLELLVDRCAGGEPAACDVVLATGPLGSEYLTRAATCGGAATTPPCAPSGPAPPAEVGSCLVWPRRDGAGPVPVPCDWPHDAQVVATAGPGAELDPAEAERCRLAVAGVAAAPGGEGALAGLRPAVVADPSGHASLCLLSVPGVALAGSAAAGDLRVAVRSP